MNKSSFIKPYQKRKCSEAIYCYQRQYFWLLISPTATLSQYVKPYRNGLEPDEETLSAIKHLYQRTIENVGFNLRSLQHENFTEILGKFCITCKVEKKFRKN